MAFATLICLLAWAVAAFTGRTDASAVSIAFGSIQALRTAAQSVIRREIDINLLMILAGAGAVAIGRYFEAATLLMLFSLSATLEAYTLGRTEKGIERLVRLRPTSALLVRDGMAVKVPVEELRPGDLVRVDPYNLVPADGIIETGGTSVDESTMTGEATPVPRGAGDEVMSGTQNLEGGITIRVTAAAQDATIDRWLFLLLPPSLLAQPPEGLMSSREVGPGVKHYRIYREAGPWAIAVVDFNYRHPALRLETVRAADQGIRRMNIKVIKRLMWPRLPAAEPLLPIAAKCRRRVALFSERGYSKSIRMAA